MPEKLERKLRKQGSKKGYTGKRLNQYIYSTLNKLGLLKQKKKRHKQVARPGR